MYFVSVKEMLQGNCQQQTQRREGKGLQDMMEWEMVSGETHMGAAAGQTAKVHTNSVLVEVVVYSHHIKILYI